MSNPIFYTEKNTEEKIQSEEKIVNLPTLKDEASTENQNIYLMKIKNFIIKHKYYLIFFGSILIISIILVIIVTTVLKNENGKNNYNEEENIFTPIFKINSKENILSQMYIKSYHNYETIKDGIKLPYIISTKFIIDIYTLNSSLPSYEDINYYKYKYFTIIIINSFCSKLNSDDCELKNYLDLNIRENNNLRRNEENNKDSIKNAILPYCIIEHTDSNMIISLTCPDTLSNSFKNEIIQIFQNIKPNSTKEILLENNNVFNYIKGDKIYINITNNNCLNNNENFNDLNKCNSSKIIITDRDGNIISNKKTISKNIIYDKNNNFSENFIYDFQNILEEKNISKFNPKIFKTNLDIIFSNTESLMRKEIYINNFTQYFIDLTTKNEEKEKKRILLKEEENKGMYEENIFNKTLFNIPITFNIINDLGIGQSQISKAISNYNINKEFNIETSINKIDTNLQKIINEFITISKSSNKLAYKLNKELNEHLFNLKNIINENINDINKFLVKKDLSVIFDSTYALKEINILPYEFFLTIKNLSISMNDLNENIIYIINNTMIKSKDEISIFIKNSHDKIFQLYQNLIEINNILSSKENKIFEIYLYYTKNKNITYYIIIDKIKNLLNNYYIYEKEKILPLLNEIIDNFYEKNIVFISNINSKLDYISEKIITNDIVINSTSKEEINQTLIYIENIKIKISEVLEIIRKEYNKTINLQNNGYFETDEYINNKSNIFNPDIEKAINISKIIDNNELIDINFDKNMIFFREKFDYLVKIMEKSLNEKYPLEENVLSISFFDNIYIKNIDNFFNTEKVNIINYIKNENYDYLNSVQNILNSFLNDNEQNLEKIKLNLLEDFSEFILDNLNNVYNNDITSIFNNINQIIENNKNLGNTYLTNVKNANSYHITQGFINKYNTYINSIQTIINFVTNDLANNLKNKYNNMLTKINQLLITIKNTNDNILEKYNKQLPFSEEHKKMISLLINRFNKYITNDFFNQKFLTQINNYITSTDTNLQNIKNNFQNIYKVVAKKSGSSITYDYDVQIVHSGSRYCCKRFLGICVDHCRDPDWYTYDGKNVAGTNNHLNLKSINFNNYFTEFDKKFNELYTKLNNNITSYNSYLNQLSSDLDSKKNEFLQKNSNYLNNIEQKIKDIIITKLENNLLKEVYTYYEKEILNILPKELNNIIEQWKIIYDSYYENITSNNTKYKSSIFEFYAFSKSYKDIYIQNISNDYINSVVAKIKNEFNYTNKYYYNLIYIKVNEAYKYILNNLPNNEIPLNEIINLRNTEINKSQKDIINIIQNSKNNYLKKNIQDDILNITSDINYFFPINNIINDHINNFINEINKKIEIIKLKIDEINIYNDYDLISAKFLLEKNINEQNIKDGYNMINKATFIDLQNNEHQNLINDIFKNDKNELNKNIINSLNNINENNNNNFGKEKEKYIQILKDKLIKEFDTKEKLEEKINKIFTEGLIDNSITENYISKINELINSILNKIKAHITNEVNRLTNEMTSYSNNYTFIQKRLYDYKPVIYEKVYTSLTKVVTNFNVQIMEKFYKNYIQKGLNDFGSYFNNNTNFNIIQFINITINLNDVMNKEIKQLTEDYNYTVIQKIEFLYQKKLKNLDNIFNFENIKSKINNETDYIYNSLLLPILKKEATYNYNYQGVSYYDLSESIINDIDNNIQEKCNNIELIMKNMEGNAYQINDFPQADFIKDKDGIIESIKSQFNNFSLIYIQYEKNKFNNIISNIILDNFENILNDFIPSFDVDFFDRILKFNEIQKINILYDNLKYSFNQTITYYLFLVSSNINQTLLLPKKIKEEILTLNNFENVLVEKQNQILSSIDNKLSKNFEEIKNYLIKKYIDDIKSDIILDLKLDQRISQIFDDILINNSKKYEAKYISLIEKYVKNPFINEYTNILNKATNNMKNYISSLKERINNELSNIFLLDIDNILNDINNKINNTYISINNFNTYLDTFKISNEVINFFDNFGDDIIFIKYDDLNNLLNKESSTLVINNLDFYLNEFINEYSIDNFQYFVTQKKKNFTFYFNEFLNIFENYGTNRENYTKNLEKEMSNFNNEINNNYNTNVDISFTELGNASLIMQEFIKKLELFEFFENSINNNIKEKNNEYECSKYILYNNYNNTKNSNYTLLIEKLNELRNHSLLYYSEANSIYQKMRTELNNNINMLNSFIKICENITYDIINAYYLEIKNKYEPINKTFSNEEEYIIIPKYTYYEIDKNFDFETEVKNYYINNIFTLDFNYEQNNNKINPYITAKIINNINPKIFNIDFYFSSGQKDKIGRKININFNNIKSFINIIYDGKLNRANIISNFEIDEYTVKTQYYEETVTTFDEVILGIHFHFPDIITYVDVETPPDEKFYEISAKNITNYDDYNY